MPKIKKYTENDIVNAIDYIESASSVREASRRYKIPNATLRWRMKNSPKKPGPVPILSAQDEQQLAVYIRYQASKGQPVTTSWLFGTATCLMKHR